MTPASKPTSVSSIPVVEDILRRELYRAEQELKEAEERIKGYRKAAESEMDVAWDAQRRITEIEKALVNGV